MQGLTLITSLDVYTCSEEGDAEVDVYHIPLCVYLQ